MKKFLLIMTAAIIIFAQITIADAQQAAQTGDIINDILVDCKMLFQESKEDLTANQGENIINQAQLKEVSDEGLVFAANEGENPFMQLALRLDEVEGEANQAFCMKFKPSAKDFGFMLSADANVGITIGEQNQPQLFILNHEYMEDLEGSLRIEPDNWYNVLLAMGSDGLMQGAIWQDRQENEAAFINLHIGQSFNDPAYQNQSWQVGIGFKGEASFTIDSYAYYTFSNFIMPDRVINMQENSQDEIPENEQGSGLISKDDILYSMLNKPQELWSENHFGFAENNGGEFGGGVKKAYNDNKQRLEIYSEDTGACIQFNTSLKTCMSDLGMEQVPQQAAIIKFSASDIVNGTRFSFEALDEITFSFRDDGIYFVDAANFFEMPIADFRPNNLELMNDTNYYFFFAYNDEGNIRMLISEENNKENKAFFEYDLYQDEADISNADIMIHFGIGENSQFNIHEYWIYTFESFTESIN